MHWVLFDSICVGYRMASWEKARYMHVIQRRARRDLHGIRDMEDPERVGRSPELGTVHPGYFSAG